MICDFSVSPKSSTISVNLKLLLQLYSRIRLWMRLCPLWFHLLEVGHLLLVLVLLKRRK